MVKLKQLKSPRSQNLFSLIARFRLVELSKIDAQRWTDDLVLLRELILSNEAMYPKINHWFSEKVLPGLKSTERVAYIAYENERPVGAAILKLGCNTKVCHLCIHEDFRDQDLGQILFTKLVMRSRQYANEMHFTLPESLWTSKVGFFESFGFLHASRANRQYRRAETELTCSAPMSRVWSAILKKLAILAKKFTPDNRYRNSEILLSVKPKYAQTILENRKRVEIRKKFSAKWMGSRAVLYSTKPVSALVGEASISSVCHGKPDEIWNTYGQHIGCSYSEYKSYVGLSEQVYAVQFGDIKSYGTPVSLTELSKLVEHELRPPQSFFNLGTARNECWTTATWIAAALRSQISETTDSENSSAAMLTR